jgi:hypothetical protein
MNTAFTALFSIECMLKIISFGVRVSRSSAMLSKQEISPLTHEPKPIPYSSLNHQYHYRFESIRKLESTQISAIADSYKQWEGLEITG